MRFESFKLEAGLFFLWDDFYLKLIRLGLYTNF